MELRAWLTKLPTYNTSTQKSTNSEWEKLDTDESMRNMRKNYEVVLVQTADGRLQKWDLCSTFAEKKRKGT